MNSVKICVLYEINGMKDYEMTEMFIMEKAILPEHIKSWCAIVYPEIKSDIKKIEYIIDDNRFFIETPFGI